MADLVDLTAAESPPPVLQRTWNQIKDRVSWVEMEDGSMALIDILEDDIPHVLDMLCGPDVYWTDVWTAPDDAGYCTMENADLLRELCRDAGERVKG